MAAKPDTIADAKHQLFTRMTEDRVSMVKTVGTGRHPQPMTHFVDADEGILWFITSSETDLARAVDRLVVATGELTFMACAQDYQASVLGHLEIVFDEAKLDQLWSNEAAAWFEDGRRDATVRLLRFTPDEAMIWASEANSLLVGLKVVRHAPHSDSAGPDIGTQAVIDFNKAA